MSTNHISLEGQYMKDNLINYLRNEITQKSISLTAAKYRADKVRDSLLDLVKFPNLPLEVSGVDEYGYPVFKKKFGCGFPSISLHKITYKLLDEYDTEISAMRKLECSIKESKEVLEEAQAIKDKPEFEYWGIIVEIPKKR